ncbi:MAG: hypothetical protein R2838_23190 [Caldilineaceae bacterium]
MPTNEERLTILRMIEQGRFRPRTARASSRRWAVTRRMRRRPPRPRPSSCASAATDSVTGRQKVSVNVPLAIVTLGLRFVPDSADLDKQALLDAIDAGLIGLIVDEDMKTAHISRSSWNRRTTIAAVQDHRRTAAGSGPASSRCSICRRIRVST